MTQEEAQKALEKAEEISQGYLNHCWMLPSSFFLAMAPIEAKSKGHDLCPDEHYQEAYDHILSFEAVLDESKNV